jgi:hypothetical protein
VRLSNSGRKSLRTRGGDRSSVKAGSDASTRTLRDRRALARWKSKCEQTCVSCACRSEAKNRALQLTACKIHQQPVGQGEAGARLACLLEYARRQRRRDLARNLLRTTLHKESGRNGKYGRMRKLNTPYDMHIVMELRPCPPLQSQVHYADDASFRESIVWSPEATGAANVPGGGLARAKAVP